MKPNHKKYKNYLIFVLVLMMLTTEKNFSQTVNWALMKEGIVRVDGITNINSFSCEVANCFNADTVAFVKNVSPKMAITMKGSIVVHLLNFNCHNSLMTKDLRKTLKVNDFPFMKINFKSINKYPEMLNMVNDYFGTVDIELSGVTKTFDVRYRILIDNKKLMHIEGSRVIKFSEFNLIPPQKLGGMIRTKDELDVSFFFNLQSLNN